MYSIGKILLSILIAFGLSNSYAFDTGEFVNGMTGISLTPKKDVSGYKGYVEGDFTHGAGNFHCNFGTLSVSQGYIFNSRLYLGAGAGVDFLWSEVDKGDSNLNSIPNVQWHNPEHINYAAFIPIFGDIRYIIKPETSVSFYIDMRIGAALLFYDDFNYSAGYESPSKCSFYLQPALGIRIPIAHSHPARSFDIGVHYRYMNGERLAYWERNNEINGLGLGFAYEW